MSGGYLLGLIGFSMASLFALAGLAINFQVWRAARRARPGERVASGIPILPGVVGSLTLFFLIPQLKTRFGVELPWPFLWILLPLVLDLQGLGGWLLALAGLRSRGPRDGAD
ncbi:MAG TPA: hypothetical protein VLA41_00025 [Burkholderiales bacterium]|nr:hypothetical protein [Burkholderiales bacterium]